MGRRTSPPAEPLPLIDPLLVHLREADARYHRLCSDLQRVDVRASELRLDDLAAAVTRIGAAIDRLRRRP